MNSEREVIELHTRIDADVVRSVGHLPDEGLRYFHSLVATEMNGLVAALWVQEAGDRGDAEVVAALLTPDLVPVAPPVRTPTIGLSYSLKMDVVVCEGRFVGFFYDNEGAHIIQLDSNGRRIGDVLTYGAQLDSGWTSLVCLEGGVVLGDWAQIATLTCR